MGQGACIPRVSVYAAAAGRFLKQSSSAVVLVQAGGRCVVGLWVVTEHVGRLERPRGRNRILLTVVYCCILLIVVH